jgi:hypothetical protein
MGFRFRRSVRIAPGLRMNFGLRGMSMSVGGRGASINIGKRGMYGNVGIPGTGLSLRSRLDARAPATATRPATHVIDMVISDDGEITITDAFGNPLSRKTLSSFKKRPEVRQSVAEQCERWNQGIERILTFHHATPTPFQGPSYEREHFALPRPARPVPLNVGFLSRMIKRWRERIEETNRNTDREWKARLAEWEQQREQHSIAEDSKEARIRLLYKGDRDVMDAMLSDHLSKLEFPRETFVSFEVEESVVWLDVDLPEIEDFPAESAQLAASTLKINKRTKSQTQIRKEYALHIHAIAFRIIGETFSVLPTVREVVFSGFSQRSDKTTGHVGNDYLLSVRVKRPAWERMNFTNISAIDLLECIASFEVRRKMTATGVLTKIEPFGP